MWWKCFDKNHGEAKYATVIASAVAALSGLFVTFHSRNDDAPSRGSGATMWRETGHGFFKDRGSEQLVDLSGAWSFAVGDDTSRAAVDFNDDDWAQIDVGSPWENEGFEDHDGFAWYRRSFDLPARNLRGQVYLRLGRIDDVDEVYFNGVKIGATGRMPPHYDSAWDALRAYLVPRELLRFDAPNVVAVRVFDGELGGGLVGEAVGLFTTPLPAPLLDLSGHWELSTVDDPRFVGTGNFEDAFRPAVVPGVWDRQGLADFDGYAWYRKTFDLSAPAGAEEWVLRLGKIDDTDEVYLNGVLIGHTGSTSAAETDFWNQTRAYPFAADLLKSDGNVLAVRVHDLKGYGGITRGPLGIMTAADHARYVELTVDRRSAWQRSWDWLLGRD
ncbi:glycoside hydrolase [Synoicihabitans lomoniglobus]|uniref:Glycoside hydrolase n=1 Tax=Synoicihabitans lomoniglobus TaxID=2909285 RepID=A0AAF0CQK7_9BACT|nr:glycoside hydrolase [Opitutaceae bacterium LMO-M01]WED66249.1 glycoside hydrolase [Opitutaceae bacterium LMO-M01]